MEIYNEEINDLLAPENRKLQIHESIEVLLRHWTSTINLLGAKVADIADVCIRCILALHK